MTVREVSRDIRPLRAAAPLETAGARGRGMGSGRKRIGSDVARHNRDGVGVDQRGFEYRVSYQPDWFRQVKIARRLPSGRRSTMTLFRNPLGRCERTPGDRARTRITCPDQGVDMEVVVGTERVSRLSVRCVVPKPRGKGEEEITFIVECGLPS